MNHDHLLRVALSCCLLSALNPAACAQSSSSLKTAPQTSTAAENEGIESGNYRVQQSIEMGYRFTDTSGSDAVYNTFVNLQSGPRILEHNCQFPAHPKTVHAQIRTSASLPTGMPAGRLIRRFRRLYSPAAQTGTTS